MIATESRAYRFTPNTKIERRAWARSPDGVIGGVCEGLSTYNIDPTLARIALAGFTLLGGSGILIYLFLWWLLPMRGEEPAEPTVWIRRPGQNAKPPLKRTQIDRKIAGVCGGIALRSGVDSTWVRLIAAAALLTLGPIAILAYAISTLAIPTEETNMRPVQF